MIILQNKKKYNQYLNFMHVTPEKIKLIEKFVKYCSDKLDLHGDIHVILSTKSQEMPTAGHFDIISKKITVSINNRAIADIMRTISHEMTHLAQLQRGVVFPSDDTSLQPFEDEANIQSGRFVRFFGRENREIYSDLG